MLTPNGSWKTYDARIVSEIWHCHLRFQFAQRFFPNPQIPVWPAFCTGSKVFTAGWNPSIKMVREAQFTTKEILCITFLASKFRQLISELIRKPLCCRYAAGREPSSSKPHLFSYHYTGHQRPKSLCNTNTPSVAMRSAALSACVRWGCPFEAQGCRWVKQNIGN